MPRPSLSELERRCQKPDFRRSGNWMARRISRPLALRLTWVLAPWRVSAHAVTGLALLVSLTAAACFGWGRPAGWLAGAVLWQFWYLLDHVDGQIARLRGTSSLDGIQFDYLMHHVVNLVMPFGLGYGVWRASTHEGWLLAGFVFAVGILVLGLANDTRYKAFVARLKESRLPFAVARRDLDLAGATDMRYHRTRRVEGWLRPWVHLARKLCEVHVLMNVVTGLVIVGFLSGSLLPLKIYLALMTPLALVTSVATVARDIRRGAAEREFARWYVPLPAESIEDRVQPDEEGEQRAQPEVVAASDFVAAGNS
ncbi:MAG TPA: CDP-alcohol phosphatidyltransferase family protein [Pirellulales bacterium]|nr:CDP-alcohol phosphatidyltransferase family protein [Pirellulales bacterium]